MMKLIFLGSSFSIVWYMRRHKVVRRSYDKEQDTFRHLFLVIPCVLLALVINERFTFKELGYLALFRHYSMLISFIITFKAGRTTRSSSCQLEVNASMSTSDQSIVQDLDFEGLRSFMLNSLKSCMLFKFNPTLGTYVENP
ncbi:hypothetical protein C5167_015223 [Papaver somniferum]|uniref:Uncharacterized protein n=1 Tax=Papaver somniferum TaxID=3469 RepID=A0A4Y7J9B0_PAPSO|nr:hypothetical protein C5167_015223 [Papaver somniferum]